MFNIDIPMGRDFFAFLRSMKSSLIDEDPQRDIAVQMTRWIVDFFKIIIIILLELEIFFNLFENL